MISSFLSSILLFSMPAEPTAEDEVLSEFRTIEKGKTEQVDFPKNEILNPIMIACTDKAIALSNIFKPTYLSLYDYIEIVLSWANFSMRGEEQMR